MATRRISSTVDKDLFHEARQISGESQAETIRQALAHYVKHAAASALPAAAQPALAAGAPVAQLSARQTLTLARRGLNSAILLLRAKASDPFPPPGVDAVAETQRINIEIADLESKVFAISQKIAALDANTLSLAPPNAATVQAISQLTDSVGQMTAAATQTDQIIAVAKQIAASVASFAP
jgi:hypothetical protein